jgi:hypothetical protein
VTALEYGRVESAHEWQTDAEAQMPLRRDPRIKSLELYAKNSDHLRIRKSQLLKATGTTSDTLTRDERARLGRRMQCIGAKTRPAELVRALHNRSMMLVSLNYGFRGDSIRQISLSDLFLRTNEKPIGHEIVYLQALYVFANHGKSNLDNRIDEVAAMRARHPLQCAVNGIAMQLYALYHLSGRELDCARLLRRRRG